MRRSVSALVLILALVAAACGGGQPGDASTQPQADSSAAAQLAVQPASYDLAATGEPERFIAGALTNQRKGLVGGTVTMRFAYLGRGQQAAQDREPVESGPTTQATFLPVPTKAPEEPVDQPTVMAPAEAVGVYETQVAFDKPGFWQVTVEADTADGATMGGTGAFRVFEEHLVPQVGEQAPKADNLTLADVGTVGKAAIDSRAGSDSDIPDPGLHRTTIAEALAQQRPFVVVFSTPVYCQSQFCGPITDAVQNLGQRYGDRAAFIHVEVWRNYDEATLNDAFDAWVNQRDQGREPWLFAVNSDGTVAQRWDNVPDIDAVESWLRQLPAS